MVIGRSQDMDFKYKFLKYLSLSGLRFFIPALLIFIFGSCREDNILFDNPVDTDTDKPWENPSLVCLPLNIAFDIEVDTRATGPVYGDETDHIIDFKTANECFAIFFDNEDKVKYIKPLYSYAQIGQGESSITNGYEYTIPVVIYVDKDDVEKELLKSVLVVLNGKPIYNKIYKTIYDTENNNNLRENVYLSNILSLTWDNHPEYFPTDPHAGREDSSSADGVGPIGVHKDANNMNLFTMTNSTYFDKYGYLRTATELNKENFFASFSEYLNYKKNEENQNDEAKKTPIVYLERMVAKFLPPTFNTEVIGSDRVFRPDQNAQPVVVYRFDENNQLYSEQLNWRIHLKGWTINGYETESFIFKNIPEFSWDGWENWNDWSNHRSYWSVDPHYDKSDEYDQNGVIIVESEHFYPWQFRKAADRNDIISVQAGINRKGKERYPVVRFNSYNDIDWNENGMYLHENTFDPEKFKPSVATNYDGRTAMLVGSHLLVTGELYLPSEKGGYNGEYDIKDNIYSDRMRRYYFDEVDFFKMFVREFNRALQSQERMEFTFYDWEGSSSDKASHKYVAATAGDYQLYFDGKPLDLNRIDELLEDKNYNYNFSIPNNARNGDGRIVPWLTKLSSRGKDQNVFIKILNSEGKELKCSIDDGPTQEVTWDINNYKSLFYSWFGPIDHYKEGKLYYAGEIRHKEMTTGENYYGTVRNHLYKFHIQSINGIGSPIDDLDQIIIPETYGYNDLLMVYLEIIPYHQLSTLVDIP